LYQKLSEEKSTLELALETTRQQCDEQQRKNADLTEEYEKERKMGSELRTVRSVFTRFEYPDSFRRSRNATLRYERLSPI
jgi:hypothetical protein